MIVHDFVVAAVVVDVQCKMMSFHWLVDVHQLQYKKITSVPDCEISFT